MSNPIANNSDGLNIFESIVEQRGKTNIFHINGLTVTAEGFATNLEKIFKKLKLTLNGQGAADTDNGAPPISSVYIGEGHHNLSVNAIWESGGDVIKNAG